MAGERSWGQADQDVRVQGGGGQRGLQHQRGALLSGVMQKQPGHGWKNVANGGKGGLGGRLQVHRGVNHFVKCMEGLWEDMAEVPSISGLQDNSARSLAWPKAKSR